MPRIVAYKCRWTEKVFTDREKFIKHLIRHRPVLVEHRLAARANRIMQVTFSKMRSECSKLEEIEQFIMDNWHVFGQNARNLGSDRIQNTPIPTLLSVKITGRYRDSVSNTHSSPFGKPRNWSQLVDLPRGYPGFHGDITYTFDKYYSGYGSELFVGTGLNTGSGGSRGNGCGYDLKLFLDDWPGLAQVQVMEKLQRPW